MFVWLLYLVSIASKKIMIFVYKSNIIKYYKMSDFKNYALSTLRLPQILDFLIFSLYFSVQLLFIIF